MVNWTAQNVHRIKHLKCTEKNSTQFGLTGNSFQQLDELKNGKYGEKREEIEENMESKWEKIFLYLPKFAVVFTSAAYLQLVSIIIKAGWLTSKLSIYFSIVPQPKLKPQQSSDR